MVVMACTFALMASAYDGKETFAFPSESTGTNVKVSGNTITMLNSTSIDSIYLHFGHGQSVDVNQIDFYPNNIKVGQMDCFGNSSGGYYVSIDFFDLPSEITIECPYFVETITVKYFLPHTHNYSSYWATTDDGHYHRCLNTIGKCDKNFIDYTAHAYGTSGSARWTCTVCGYVNESIKAPYDAEEPINLINASGEVHYTAACKNKIDAARAAYDPLSDTAKAIVTNYDVLTAAEATYAHLTPTDADMDAAYDVIIKIGDIGTVEATSTCRAKILVARISYNRLTDAAKEQVANYDDLVAAEARYAELTSGNGLLQSSPKKFQSYQETAVIAADLLAQSGDSDACKALIEEAKAAIGAMEYDRTKSPEDNLAAVDAQLVGLMDALDAQRAADAACPVCGETEHDSRRTGILHAVFAFLKGIIKNVLLPLWSMIGA